MAAGSSVYAIPRTPYTIRIMSNPDQAFGVRLGDRVRLLAMGADPHPLAAGVTGTVSWLCDSPGLEQVVVDWDNGRRLALLPGVDRFERID